MSLIYHLAEDGNYYAKIRETQKVICDFSDNAKHFKETRVTVTLQVKKVIRQKDNECVKSTIIGINCPYLRFSSLKQFPCTHCDNYIPEFKDFVWGCKYDEEIRQIKENRL
jgi:hypothetical protein